VLSYTQGVRDGRPWADQVRVLGPGAVAAVTTQLSGWYVSGDPDFGRNLISAGADMVRHAHSMLADLVAVPPPLGWATPRLPAGIRLTPVDRPAAEIFPMAELAYGPDHADRRYDRRTATERAAGFAALLAGEAIGPLNPTSALAVDGTDQSVALVAIFDRTEALPWIGQLIRRPGDELRGLGDAMLRRAMVDVAGAGFSQLGLAVSDGNPAQRLYERLGFTVAETSFTVLVP
jgi:GNAT superfamily N-acetyltransferase